VQDEEEQADTHPIPSKDICKNVIQPGFKIYSSFRSPFNSCDSSVARVMASLTATGQICSWLETRPLKEGIVFSSPGLPAPAAIHDNTVVSIELPFCNGNYLPQGTNLRQRQEGAV
jgi:hypothetical protein